jgi:hypothetical protein
MRGHSRVGGDRMNSLPEPEDGEDAQAFVERFVESDEAYRVLGDDRVLRLRVAAGQLVETITPLAGIPECRYSVHKLERCRDSIKFVARIDSGLPVQIGGQRYKIVHDLGTLRLPEQPIPVRLQHEDSSWGDILGWTEHTQVRPMTAMAEGYLLVDGSVGRVAQILKAAQDLNHIWRMSPRTETKIFSFVQAGYSCRVNDRLLVGPLLIARHATLKELSICSEHGAADNRTYVLFQGTPMFSRYSACRVTSAQLEEHRLSALRGEVAYDEAKAAAHRRAEEIRSQLQRWEGEDNQEERNQLLMQKRHEIEERFDAVKRHDMACREWLASESRRRLGFGEIAQRASRSINSYSYS